MLSFSWLHLPCVQEWIIRDEYIINSNFEHSKTFLTCPQALCIFRRSKKHVSRQSLPRLRRMESLTEYKIPGLENAFYIPSKIFSSFYFSSVPCYLLKFKTFLKKIFCWNSKSWEALYHWTQFRKIWLLNVIGLFF